MATTPGLMSIEQYLRTSFSPDVDFVDGGIEERNLGEFDHARLQALLTGLFLMREEEWGLIAVVEQRIRVSPKRVRICDVALLREDAPREKVTETPPLVCIEVLSPEDRLARAKLVLADYLSLGVENIWLIDPIRRAVFTYDSAGLHDIGVDALTVAGTSISVDIQQLFRKLD